MPKRADMPEENQFENLVRVFSEIKTPGLMRRFLNDLLTPNERREISQRWQLVKHLHEGMSQREIARKLKVSLCKITRGSRELKRARSGFVEVLKKNIKKNGT
ncbi:MAG: trp operon repressor [bacterium]